MFVAMHLAVMKFTCSYTYGGNLYIYGCYFDMDGCETFACVDDYGFINCFHVYKVSMSPFC